MQVLCGSLRRKQLPSDYFNREFNSDLTYQAGLVAFHVGELLLGSIYSLEDTIVGHSRGDLQNIRNINRRITKHLFFVVSSSSKEALGSLFECS